MIGYCELDGHGITEKHLSKGAGFFFAEFKTVFPKSILQLHVCYYNQGLGGWNISEDTDEEISPDILPLRVFRVLDQEETSPMSPFHMSSCLLLHWEGRGDTLISCPNNFGTFAMLLKEAFHCLIWCPQLPASPGNCSLYLCLQPGSTVQENLNSHHSDTTGPKREVLMAKSSLTTEASLPKENYHHPQPIVGKLRHKEIKNILMMTQGGCATGRNQTHSPKTVLPLHYRDRYINTHMHTYIYHSTLKMRSYSSGTIALAADTIHPAPWLLWDEEGP